MNNYRTTLVKRVAFRTTMKRGLVLFVAVLGLLVMFTTETRAINPCCNITAINLGSGVLSAKENATGRTFTFKVSDVKLLNSLKVGQGIYADFSGKKVSVNGADPCCPIVTLGAAAAKPIELCCFITAVNGKTGEITVKENATGRVITFTVAANAAALIKPFKVGDKVGFGPINGLQLSDAATLKPGFKVRLTVPGLTPVDSVVARIAAQ